MATHVHHLQQVNEFSEKRNIIRSHLKYLNFVNLLVNA
jgi:hypothetical protein